ncbi:acyl CoA binding protein [Lojkania enalia]|uniref:Acyl CoA binding protein n=1 Tax=Lojkania enalia TaxID=147567 RepID=A0A9P4K257_9PLEO|nr:acyl CoA binding protein [Didymosphaeria enalia]
MSQSEAFEKAWDEVAKLKQKPDNNELLELYAYGAIGQNKDISQARKLSMYEIAERNKQKKWKTYLDQGVTQEEAQKKYIDIVESLKKKYGFNG